MLQGKKGAKEEVKGKPVKAKVTMEDDGESSGDQELYIESSHYFMVLQSVISLKELLEQH